MVNPDEVLNLTMPHFLNLLHGVPSQDEMDKEEGWAEYSPEVGESWVAQQVAKQQDA